MMLINTTKMIGNHQTTSTIYTLTLAEKTMRGHGRSKEGKKMKETMKGQRIEQSVQSNQVSRHGHR